MIKLFSNFRPHKHSVADKSGQIKTDQDVLIWSGKKLSLNEDANKYLIYDSANNHIKVMGAGALYPESNVILNPFSGLYFDAPANSRRIYFDSDNNQIKIEGSELRIVSNDIRLAHGRFLYLGGEGSNTAIYKVPDTEIVMIREGNFAIPVNLMFYLDGYFNKGLYSDGTEMKFQGASVKIVGGHFGIDDFYRIYFDTAKTKSITYDAGVGQLQLWGDKVRIFGGDFYIDNNAKLNLGVVQFKYDSGLGVVKILGAGKHLGLQTDTALYFDDSFNTAWIIYDSASGNLLINGVPVKFANDIEIADATKGVILKSPDNSRWRITVGDDGLLSTTKIV
jgi:hypothetical protein